jgi:hypothetical protein
VESFVALVLGASYILIQLYWIIVCWWLVRSSRVESERVYNEEEYKRGNAASNGNKQNALAPRKQINMIHT